MPILHHGLTPKQFEILRYVCRYYVLLRRQIQKLVYPSHKSGRKTRDQLHALYNKKLVARTNLMVPYLDSTVGAPCYYPTDPGRRIAAQYFRDPSLELTSTRSPRSSHLQHWVDIAEVHLRIDQAVQRESGIALKRWVNEWCKFRTEDGNESDEFVLHTMLRDLPGDKLSVSPDAAMVLHVNGIDRLYFFEIDRGTMTPHGQVAGSKWRGYHELITTGKFLEKFPSVQTKVRVIVVATDAWQRDRLARAFANYSGKEFYRFVALEDLQPGSFFHSPIFVDHEVNQRQILVGNVEPGPPLATDIKADGENRLHDGQENLTAKIEDHPADCAMEARKSTA